MRLGDSAPVAAAARVAPAGKASQQRQSQPQWQPTKAPTKAIGSSSSSGGSLFAKAAAAFQDWRGSHPASPADPTNSVHGSSARRRLQQQASSIPQVRAALAHLSFPAAGAAMFGSDLRSASPGWPAGSGIPCAVSCATGGAGSAPPPGCCPDRGSQRLALAHCGVLWRTCSHLGSMPQGRSEKDVFLYPTPVLIDPSRCVPIVEPVLTPLVLSSPTVRCALLLHTSLVTCNLPRRPNKVFHTGSMLLCLMHGQAAHAESAARAPDAVTVGGPTKTRGR